MGQTRNRKERFESIGTGTLRDHDIRYKCVCPMQDCPYVVPAYMQLRPVIMKESRTLRPYPRAPTTDQKQVIDNLNDGDGGVPNLDEYGDIVMVQREKQNRIPQGRERFAHNEEAMKDHIASVHKSDPASDRQKAPTLTRPKLDDGATGYRWNCLSKNGKISCSASPQN